MTHYVDDCARRLAETAGLSDLVMGLVDQIHHQVRIGKGDENVNVNLSPKGASDHYEKSADADDKSLKHQDLSQQHADKRDAAKASGDTALADHHDKMSTHHANASSAYSTASDHFKARRMTKGNAFMKQAGAHTKLAASQKLRAPKAPLKQSKPLVTQPTPQPAAPIKKARKPRAPKAAPGASPGASPSVSPAPKVRKPRTKTPSIRAANPNQKAGPDPNDTSGAQSKTATRDVEVTGKINGRSITTTIHAGQEYHLKEVDGQTQLVMPGLFGKFLLNAGEKGKL